MGKPGNTGLRRVWFAAIYSTQGLKDAWRHEAAFRQEVVAALLLLPVALWLGRTPFEVTALLGSLVFVIVVELLNSAVEAAIDRHGDEIHTLSGRAKDLGSAAVMLSIGLSLAVWGVIAWNRFGSS